MQADECSVPARTQIHPSDYVRSWSDGHPAGQAASTRLMFQPDTGSAPLFGLCSRPLDRVFGLRCLWVLAGPTRGSRKHSARKENVRTGPC